MPPGVFLNQIAGIRGEIRIPSIGVVVARLTKPQLHRRREVASPELGRFDLHAAVSYFNQHLWDDEDYDKEVRIWLSSRPKPVKVFLFENSQLSVVSGSLRIEGVEPEWQEPQRPLTPVT